MKRFITTVIICIIIYGAAAAMVNADISSRKLSGEYDRKLFSFEEVGTTSLRVEVFGQVYMLDTVIITQCKDKFTETFKYNAHYIPEFLLNTGELITAAFVNFIKDAKDAKDAVAF